MMNDIIANEIKEFAIERLRETYGFCGCASDTKLAMINSSDRKGTDIHITIALKNDND